MADKEAKIRIGIDNVAQTIADLNKIKGSFKGIADSLAGVTKLAKSTASAVADLKPFDPKTQTDNLEKYRLSLTRMSVAMGLTAKEADYLRARFDKISSDSGLKSEDVADAAEQYGRLTLDMKGAADSMEDLVTVSNNTNRSLAEMVQIGANLHNNLGVPLRDVGKELRELGEMASKAGTRGGRMGLVEMVTSLGSQLQKFDTSTPKKRKRLEAFVAAMGGDLPAEAAKESASAALGWFSGEALGLGRYLGRKSIIDPATGKVGDPGEILDAIKKKVRATRNKAAALRVLGNYVNLQGAPKALALSSGTLDQLSTTQEDIDRKRAEDEYKRQEREYEQGNMNFIPQPGDLNPQLPFLPPAMREIDRTEKDRLAPTPAGELERARRENEILQRNMADPLLKGRDAYHAGYKGRRGEQVADETTIDMLKETPVLGALGTAAHMHTASEAKSRAERLQEEQLREQRKTNHLLERRAKDPNTSAVKSRNAPVN